MRAPLARCAAADVEAALLDVRSRHRPGQDKPARAGAQGRSIVSSPANVIVYAPIGGRTKVGRLYLRALKLATTVAPIGDAAGVDARLATFNRSLEELGLELVKLALREGWRP